MIKPVLKTLARPGLFAVCLCLLAACGNGIDPRSKTVADPNDTAFREGPWRMQCFVDDEVVIDVPEVYRVRRQTRAGGWVYVTPDGTVIRGRITAGANCVWTRPGEPVESEPVDSDTETTQVQDVE